MPSVDRRRLLSAVSSLAGGLTLAGCTSRFSDSPTRLRELYVNNRRETAHRLTVQVVVDGETAFETERDLGPNASMERLPTEWSPEATSYTVTATLDGEEETAASFDDSDDECVSVEITTETDQPLFMWISPCPSSLADGEYCD